MRAKRAQLLVYIYLYIFIVSCVGGSKAKSVLYFPYGVKSAIYENSYSTGSTIQNRSWVIENFLQLTVNRIHESAAGPAASVAKQRYLKGAKTASDS